MTATTQRSTGRVLEVPYEKHVLSNGLQVVIHEDHTSPVVAVFVCYHVGSAREEPGKSGFAHLFEHMLFQGSENVGDNDHFRHVSEAGGTLNGNTTTDRTLYFETLPSNQLELALWLEADRMGFLLPAMTQEKLDNQRDVVLNERRQNYENRPYGQAQMAICEALFPTGHPYSWTTIGSAEDIEGATLEDVRSFFRRWYNPNNATVAIGGDVDPDRALALVERYFGGIPTGPAAPRVAPQPAELLHDVRLVQEDRVHLPRVVLAWPTPERGHPDCQALKLLAMLLSQNKSSVLDRALMVDEVLAREVFVLDWPGELAGRFMITATAAPGVELGTIESRVRGLLADLARAGIDAEALERMKGRQEADFVRALETVSARTSELVLSNTLRGNPVSFLDDQLRLRGLQPDEVQAALVRYLVDRPAVVLSIVPEGKPEQAAPASSEAPRSRPLPAGHDLDRSRRPAAAPAPDFRPPAVWHDDDPSGLTVTGVALPGSPLVTARLSVPGGRVLERPQQIGLATLVADLLEEGTTALSTTELTEQLDSLGANLWVRAGSDQLHFTLTALDRHLPAAAKLLSEVVFTPRLARTDFERLKTLRLAAIESREDRIQRVAADAWQHVLFGNGLLGAPTMGTQASIESLTRDDAARHHERAIRPVGARLDLVGDLDAEATREVFGDLRDPWNAAPPRGSHPPGGPLAAPVAAPFEPGVYLVHKAGAAQSELRVGHLSVSSFDPDWYPLHVLNYVLGGNFNSRINMNLREDKGYTYGSRSSFEGGVRPGAFVASAAVHTEVTGPALIELVAELERIREGVTAAELDFARDGLTQALLRRFEASAARLALASNISLFGWPDDYPAQRLEVLAGLGTQDLRDLAARHIDPSALRILVVGDRDRVRPDLEALGRGPVRELDSYGHPLTEDVQAR